MTRSSRIVVAAAAAAILWMSGGSAVADPAQPGDPYAWPQAVIERPATLLTGMVSSAGDLEIFHDSVTLGTITSGVTTERLGLSVDYGVTDRLELGVSYQLALHDFEDEGPLTLRATFRMMQCAKVSAAIDAGLTDNVLTGDVDLDLGFAYRYRFAPWFAVYTPGQQLGIGVEHEDVTGRRLPTPIVLALPVGVAFQASPRHYLFAQTDLAHIGIHIIGNTLIGRDFMALGLGLVYSPSNRFDLGLSLGFPDLEAGAGSAYSFLVSLRLFKS
jgi:hypothetical protein